MRARLESVRFSPLESASLWLTCLKVEAMGSLVWARFPLADLLTGGADGDAGLSLASFMRVAEDSFSPLETLRGFIAAPPIIHPTGRPLLPPPRSLSQHSRSTASSREAVSRIQSTTSNEATCNVPQESTPRAISLSARHVCFSAVGWAVGVEWSYSCNEENVFHISYIFHLFKTTPNKKVAAGNIPES